MEIPFTERIYVITKDNNNILSELKELQEISNIIKDSSFRNCLTNEIKNSKKQNDIRRIYNFQNREMIEMKRKLFRIKAEYDKINQKLNQVMENSYFNTISLANENLDQKIKLIKQRIKSNELNHNKGIKVFLLDKDSNYSFKK